MQACLEEEDWVNILVYLQDIIYHVMRVEHIQACLEEEDCVNIHVYLQDIILMKSLGKIHG